MNLIFQSRALTVALVATMALIAQGHAAILSQTTPARIMCLGDSITEGKFVGGGGYRKPLQDLLRAAGYSFSYVGKEDDGQPGNDTGCSRGMENPNHEGYGSFRIDEILNGGKEEGHVAPPIAQTLANYHPDVILMMLGSNDVLQNHEIASIGDRLKALVDAIFAANDKTALVLAEITPISSDRDATALAYNAQVASLVDKEKAQGRNIVLADMHSALVPGKDTDGVHPNQSGYAKMASVWYEALTGKRATTPAIAAAGLATGGDVFTFTDAKAEGNSASYVLGFQFTTGDKPLTVGALGYLNDGATGAKAEHQVGIYEVAGQKLVTPVVSVTTSGGALSGPNATFTYVKLDQPVVLAAHTAYAIGAVESGHGYLKTETGLAFQGIDPCSVHAVFTEGGSGLVYPGKTYAPNDPANFGPNFQLRP